MTYREFGGGIEALESMDGDEAIKHAKDMGLEVHLLVATYGGQPTEQVSGVFITQGKPDDRNYRIIRRVALGELSFPEDQKEVIHTSYALAVDLDTRRAALRDRWFAVGTKEPRGLQMITDAFRDKNKAIGNIKQELDSVASAGFNAWQKIEKGFYESKITQQTPTKEQLQSISDGALQTFQNLQNRLNEVEKKLAALEK